MFQPDSKQRELVGHHDWSKLLGWKFLGVGKEMYNEACENFYKVIKYM